MYCIINNIRKSLHMATQNNIYLINACILYTIDLFTRLLRCFRTNEPIKGTPIFIFRSPYCIKLIYHLIFFNNTWENCCRPSFRSVCVTLEAEMREKLLFQHCIVYNIFKWLLITIFNETKKINSSMFSRDRANFVALRPKYLKCDVWRLFQSAR